MRSIGHFVAFTATFMITLICRADDEVVLFDFENETHDGWEVEGNAFHDGPIDGSRFDIHGYRGSQLVNSFGDGDSATGSLTSPEFELTADHLSFLIGGGNHPGETGVELLVDGRSVREATGIDSGDMQWRSWDVAPFRGQTAKLRIFDRATGGWGHINLDHVVFTATPRTGSGIWRLDDYRQSTQYYRERYRSQFHFSPELNWMNDPNGLVYFDGEYHLFYQHNPHGNGWGHMSWGHAVSLDLVHWEHLPIALHEEYGVMAFSGSCVVDWNNTSGFGVDGEPPLVAIYTGHQSGRQTQDIAYSTDRCRHWTKYVGNPVLDIGEADFRDPKVFWHADTERWIMIVSLATQKRVQFYGSHDLKSWTHLSDFGPAGAPDKLNWECPDLFELQIEGEPGETRWVLEVGMGNGSIAGGSGGEYFIGHFDGQSFICEDAPDEVHWIDYGRDYYAPVSWSDIPAEDGRRIWIGWMNNWETSLLPTAPWRSEMSIPRSLSLRRVDGRLQLVQAPVAELQSLRGEPWSLQNVKVDDVLDLTLEYGIEGSQLEIIAEIEPGPASMVGFVVRAGETEQTRIEVDIAPAQLSVDRTRSGHVDFHPAFAGIHVAPLSLRDGRIKLQIFVDQSSIEVFGNDGETVITDRIFPAEESQGVQIYATGEATIHSLSVWPLRSIWHAVSE